MLTADVGCQEVLVDSCTEVEYALEPEESLDFNLLFIGSDEPEA